MKQNVNCGKLRSILLRPPNISSACERVFDDLVNGDYEQVLSVARQQSSEIAAIMIFAMAVARSEEFDSVLTRLEKSADELSASLRLACLIGILEAANYFNEGNNLVPDQQERIARMIATTLRQALHAPIVCESQLSRAISGLFGGDGDPTLLPSQRNQILCIVRALQDWDLDSLQQNSFPFCFCCLLSKEYWFRKSLVARFVAMAQGI